MKTKGLVLTVIVLLLSILACSVNAPVWVTLATMTPYPTNTPYPTYTPIPTATLRPTATVMPSGATALIDGVEITISSVEFADRYTYEGETYFPKADSDMFAIVSVVLGGEIPNFLGWMVEGSDGLQLRDGSGRLSDWAVYEVSRNGMGVFVFVVDEEADSLIMVFPGGQEIDLTSYVTDAAQTFLLQWKLELFVTYDVMV